MSIKFSLKCTSCKTKFEGWFPSNKDYEKQHNKGQLTCPMCDSKDVTKDIMAPAVRTKKTKKIPDDYMVMGESAESILRKLNRKIKKDFSSFQNESQDFQKGGGEHVPGKRSTGG